MNINSNTLLITDGNAGKSSILPQLLKQKESTILNISSGLAYIPFLTAPFYTITKADFLSYSLSMRRALKNTSVKVFEALPLMIDTGMISHMEIKGMTKR